MADDPSPTARELAACDPEASAELIEALSHDRDFGVRAAMAQDPRLSVDRLIEFFGTRGLALRAGGNPNLPEEAMRATLDLLA
ncbi:hypothetical protein [Yinghuangia sp. YIM S09857]|uniref:hypothetical protein n=1 Tax=Yinghuangia sp. YIM S09857 TaxID=3436929 RepID=UPI003F52F975